jgi:hypothetical protein
MTGIASNRRLRSATAVVASLAATFLFGLTPAFAYVGAASAPDEANLSNHNTYTNRDGQTVHSPARSLSGQAPEGATARCRDGTYSFSRHHSGTCSRHGGVVGWL